MALNSLPNKKLCAISKASSGTREQLMISGRFTPRKFIAASRESSRTAMMIQSMELNEEDVTEYSDSNETLSALRIQMRRSDFWVAEAIMSLTPPFRDTLEEINIFSLNFLPKTQRYYFSSDHKPSDTATSEDPNLGWNGLYRAIKRAGYRSGSQLVCWRRRKDSFVLTCFCCKKSRSLSTHHVSSDSDEPFSDHARPHKMRRSKGGERKKPISKAAGGGYSMAGTRIAIDEHLGTNTTPSTSPKRKHSKTRLATKKNCNVRLTVHVNFELDRFYIKTGFGCSIHKHHPTLMSSEICALLPTVPDEDKSPPTGMSQEYHMPQTSEGDHACLFPDPDTEPCSIHTEKASLYQAFSATAKSICRYQTHFSPQMNQYLLSVLAKMEEETMLHVHGKFQPPQLSSNSISENETHTSDEKEEVATARHQTLVKGRTSNAIVSSHPQVD